ncbi:MAG: hypothetical protein A2201_03560 [Alicyclobacillus sp. RIFOXYA1_FULL_53_8]|nr:MAG: hypothetical protein A2201_03560 [Alicyclobacillus sp. RIFOXYA1_FULL_53_8]
MALRRQSVSTRTLVGGVLAGAAFGSALTLAILTGLGVRLQPNLQTPAFNKFFSAYEDLTQRYYFPVTQQALLDGAIRGMTQALNDPFTAYFTPAAAKQFQKYLSNSFDGIGVVLEQSGGEFLIVSVTPHSPAEKAGLHALDVITKVDGKSLQGLSIDQVSQQVVGPLGTQVKLTILRRSEADRTFEVSVTRAKITSPSVTSKMLTNHVGYLAISVVGNETSQEVKDAVAGLKKQGATRLVIDLRGNGGGYLEQAELIADQLIPTGKVVVQTQAAGKQPELIRSTGPGLKMPMAVLMDKDTASAAEVLAAALHEDIKAPLIGTISYGKGTVQETQMYPDGSGLKYTVARWLTPTGAWIHHRGLTPTDTVALPSYFYLSPLTQAALPLQSGQNTPDVSTLQKVLQALGYKLDRNDGYFDESTVQALKQFQTSVKLPATGMANRATANLLQASLQDLLARSDTQLQKAQQVVLQESP